MLYPWNIIGHERQLESLEKELAGGKMTHAYLFHGPKDTGKFTVAKLLAKILLCPNNLCHHCRDCKMVDSGVHPDFILMSDDGSTIKIDEVRALVQKTNLTSQGERRVVLIENIERMPIEAQNSFLKTLEEPAGKTIFLLTSSQPKDVLPTILSRVRQLEFGLVDKRVMSDAMLTRFPDHSDLEEALEIAHGRPGLAIRLLGDPVQMAAYRALFHQIDDFLRRNDLIGKFSYVESLDESDERTNLFFEAFALRLRKLIHDYAEGKAVPLESRYTLKDLTELFEKLLETRYLTSRNVNKKLALENFFLATER